MSDRFPTFRRWSGAPARAWAKFSYRDSLTAQGAVWTLSAWLIGGVISAVLFFIGGALGEDGASARGADASMSSILLVFPGSPVIGFIIGAALAGRAAGFLDSLWRGLKVSVFLFSSLQILAILTLAFGDEKAGLVAAVLFWIGVSALLAGLTGAVLRWIGEKTLPAPGPAPEAAAEAVPVPAGSPWLEAVAGALREAGLCDYATATVFHRQLQRSGQAAPGARAPFEDKYDAVFAGLAAAFPGKSRADWLAANEDLRRAALIAAGAGSPARVRPALEAAFPGMSSAFYDWAADCSRRLR